jgi:hypothetical protein
MKFILVSLMIMSNGTVERGVDHPGYGLKQHVSMEECEYHKFQNMIAIGSYGVGIMQVVQFCVPVEERAA